MSLVVAVIVALFFFLAGCLKLGIFIAKTPMLELAPYLDSLLICVWPLAVAAALFVLIDIRLDRRHTAPSTEDDILESPIERRVAPRASADASQQKASYFRIDGQDLPPSRPPQTVQQPMRCEEQRSEVSFPFATPPPFQNCAPLPQKPAESEQPKPPNPTVSEDQEQSGELNFFKL